MKKVLKYLILTFLVIALAACNNNQQGANNGTDTDGRGTQNTGYNRNSDLMNNNYQRVGYDNTGNTEYYRGGTYNYGGTNNGYRQMGYDNNATNMNNNQRQNNNNRYEVADRAADEVAKLQEVGHAYTLVTDNNAYVAVTLRDDEKVTKELEEKIADRVRKTVKGIDNVYVSANPDFMQQIHDYREDVRQGNPVEGFAEEFTDIIERIFPTRR